MDPNNTMIEEGVLMGYNVTRLYITHYDIDLPYLLFILSVYFYIYSYLFIPRSNYLFRILYYYLYDLSYLSYYKIVYYLIGLRTFHSVIL